MWHGKFKIRYLSLKNWGQEIVFEVVIINQLLTNYLWPQKEIITWSFSVYNAKHPESAIQNEHVSPIEHYQQKECAINNKTSKETETRITEVTITWKKGNLAEESRRTRTSDADV